MNDISLTFTMNELQRHQIIMELINGHLTAKEARDKIGLKSVRQVRRIKKRVLKLGAKGVIHGNKGRASNRRITEAKRAEIINLIKVNYHDFKPTFANEKLRSEHGITIGTETLRQVMIAAKLWRPKPRKTPSSYHSWRPRRDNYGDMQQFDGCYHRWLEDRADEMCLLLAIDDATSSITHAEFADNEGVVAVFCFWQNYFLKHGLPLNIYLDKFSTYKINHPKAVDNSDLKTQFQRAMQQLGVKDVTAHSPQAKGRVERVFRTLQDRLIKEMRLKGINDIKAANQFLQTEFIPAHNRRFAVAAAKPADMHRQLDQTTKQMLPQILAVRTERKVQNDYTVTFKKRWFQLANTQPTTIYKKDTVIITEYLDGSLHILSQKEHQLSFVELPQRPRSINILLPAITRQRPIGISLPGAHAWRSQADKFTTSCPSTLGAASNLTLLTQTGTPGGDISIWEKG